MWHKLMNISILLVQPDTAFYTIYHNTELRGKQEKEVLSLSKLIGLLIIVLSSHAPVDKNMLVVIIIK